MDHNPDDLNHLDGLLTIYGLRRDGDNPIRIYLEPEKYPDCDPTECMGWGYTVREAIRWVDGWSAHRMYSVTRRKNDVH